MNLMLRMVRGFVDLISLAVMSECKFQAMNMTTMRVQGLPTLLNKNVSAGDDCWELRWEEIPEALRCYALGDIRFGFITYNVLAGLLLRDIFPDPDILCYFLKCSQSTAMNWILELVVMSLEAEEEELLEEEMDLDSGRRSQNARIGDH